MIEDTCTFAEDVGDGCTLSVRVHPGARKNDVTGIHAGAVKISLTTPPVDGRATNEALIDFLAELLRIPRVRIALLTGTTIDEIVQQIITLISNGDLNAGQRLPSERELCKEFAAGRSSLREALRCLSIMGVLTARVGEGTSVAIDGSKFMETVCIGGYSQNNMISRI